jgi:CubicO group peptidase (beta-lactamase class C family)
MRFASAGYALLTLALGARADSEPLLAAPSPITGTAAAAKATDTAAATASGASFIAPAGWSLQGQNVLRILTAPGGDLQLVLAEVPASDAAAAVAVAWAAFDPKFKQAPRQQLPELPRFGWSERRSFRYQDSGNTYLAVMAQHADGPWLVSIACGSRAAREQHRAELDRIADSLRAPGWQAEDYSGRKPRPIDARFVQDLRDFLSEAMSKLRVPGASFSLIDNGGIAYAGGIGVRRLGRPEPVDADTLFPIASNTKPLTTLLLAEMVDQGKLRWDEPVTQAWPAFKVGDPVLTTRLQIRDLACMCTGIPEDYVELFRVPWSAEAILHSLAGMKPVAAYGERYIYSNFMVEAAGFIAGMVAEPGHRPGPAYVHSMEHQVLRPMGMGRSTFDFARALRDNHASPHDVDEAERIVPIPIGIDYSVAGAPSGGLWSSANELSRYVLMELNKGVLPNGQRLVSEQNLLQRYEPGIPFLEGMRIGNGLVIDKRFGGITVIHHAGDIRGYHSDMIWLPDYDVGAVFLTNGDRGVYLRRIFLRRFVEQLFDGRPDAAAQVAAMAERSVLEQRDQLQREQIPADATAAGQLAARYYNVTLGELRVRHSGATLDFDFGGWHSAMGSHRNDDGTVVFKTISPGVRGFEFSASTRNGRRVLVDHNDAPNEYSFVEKP